MTHMDNDLTPIGEPLFDCDWCEKPILCTDHLMEDGATQLMAVGDFEITASQMIVHPGCKAMAEMADETED